MRKSPIEKAREERSRRAAIMADLGHGAITVAEALRNDSGRFSGMTLWAVLTHAYKLGPTGAHKVCQEAGMQFPNLTRIDELTKAEKDAIIAALPKRVQP